MSHHHERARDDSRRNRDRNNRVQSRSDVDRSDDLSGGSASATLDASSDDPIISGGRSSSRDDWDHPDRADDFGSDHDDSHDDDRYGHSVTYHDESDHSYGASDSHHDSHGDSDHFSLVAPSSDLV